MNGWTLIALGIGLAAGFIYGFIEGRKFTLGQFWKKLKGLISKTKQLSEKTG